MIYAAWILTAIVGLAFPFFGIVKIFGVPETIYRTQKESYFDRFGLARWHVRLIGLAELFGGLTIWLWATRLQPLAHIGMITLMVVTLGAMVYHARYDKFTKDGMPPFSQFVFSGALLLLTLSF